MLRMFKRKNVFLKGDISTNKESSSSNVIKLITFLCICVTHENRWNSLRRKFVNENGCGSITYASKDPEMMQVRNMFVKKFIRRLAC